MSVDPRLVRVLEEAQTIALYSVKYGKMSGGDLAKAVEAFSAAKDPGWGSPETTRLLDAVERAVAGIAPLTIQDIKSENVFERWQVQKRLRSGFLIAFTLLVILATAVFTNHYASARELLDRATAVLSQRPGDKLVDVARLMNDNKTSGDLSAGTATAAMQLLSDVRDQDSKVRTLLVDQARFRDGVVFRLLLQLGITTNTKQYLGEKVTEDSTVTFPGTPPMSEDWNNQNPGKFLRTNRDMILNLALTEGIKINPYFRADYVLDSGSLRSILQVYSQWLLPGLYGVLGALVVYLRAILTPSVPNPPLPNFAIRIALGGFAAIIFAWFWLPSASGIVEANVGVNTFALSFIIGFSLDLFFDLLDRAVGLVKNALSVNGTRAMFGDRSGVSPTPGAPVQNSPTESLKQQNTEQTGDKRPNPVDAAGQRGDNSPTAAETMKSSSETDEIDPSAAVESIDETRKAETIDPAAVADSTLKQAANQPVSDEDDGKPASASDNGKPE